MTTLTIGELFAGYGGIALGVGSVLDTEVAWYSEIAKGPSAIMAAHHPDVPNLGDVEKVDWTAVPRVDILTGGTPCQDLSHAGMRLGMRSGTRSGLWASMREAIAVIRPSLVIWENVQGVYSAQADSAMESDARLLGRVRRRRDDAPYLRALGRVLGDLASLGYMGGWSSLRAADIGAPHRRRRVFVFAYPEGEALPTPIGRPGLSLTRGSLLPTPRGSDATGISDHGEGGLDLQSTIALLPTPAARDHKSGGPADNRRHGKQMTALPYLLPSPAVNDMGGNKTVEWWDEWAPRQKASDGRHAPHGKSLAIELQRLPTPTAKDADSSGSTQQRTATHHPGTTLTDAAVRYLERWGDYAEAVSLWEYLTRAAPEPTEVVEKSGKRRLAPAFSEWMMGLPAGWVTDVDGVGRTEALRAIGNGVVPQQIAVALSFMIDVLDGAAVTPEARPARPRTTRVDPSQLSLWGDAS